MTTIRSANATMRAPNPGEEAVGANSYNYSYPEDIEFIREREYPAIKGTTYLDHAGTTLYAKSMIESYTADLTHNLLGNPHSASASSQLSSRRIDDIRLQVLRFFHADPKDFDLIFVANATAAIKLVADALRDRKGGFWYGYHCDSHTSLIGVRELASLGSTCLRNDDAVEDWIDNLHNQDAAYRDLVLFGYPGQSNMTGRRLPYDWCHRIRSAAAKTGCRALTLFDAAALASTFPLDLSNVDTAPDFTALSFYKIFGFPDLGALIVRKNSGGILRGRKYFAGGTVDMVSACGSGPWHAKKEILHHALEDGTLPFHNIIALGHALEAHNRLYGSMQNVAHHTSTLRASLYERMKKLKHQNGRSVCRIYGQQPRVGSTYGPVIAFNLLDSSGDYISNSGVDKLGIVKNIQFRSGGLCNPGGVATHLDLTTEDLKNNYAAGHRCGDENFFSNSKPTGVIRVSLGAMSSASDVDVFIEFLEEFYVSCGTNQMSDTSIPVVQPPRFRIASMSVFPIKSCSAFKVPAGVDWEVSAKGLAWDREWCLVHQGTNIALSQKQHPKMALILPKIDLKRRLMVVSSSNTSENKEIGIGLDDLPNVVGSLKTCAQFKQSQSTICGESVLVHIYTSPEVNEFFSEAIGTPCSLARHFTYSDNVRLARLRRPRSKRLEAVETHAIPPAIKLSNESPILLISRSSVNHLNEQIRQHRNSVQEVLPESFRANIVVSEQSSDREVESPYAEDSWRQLAIGTGESAAAFEVLGPCQRCQMVCVDQASAKRRSEPFSTLAKTRRWDGGVWFGVHLCLTVNGGSQRTTLRIGETVHPS